MIEIPLTQGKVALVDDCDAHLADYKWHYRNGYAAKSIRLENGKKTSLLMHQAILGHPLHGNEIDHVSGDCLFNGRVNIRIVTHKENMKNQKCHRGEKFRYSRHLGVTWHKSKKKWQAQTMVNGKHIFIGRYETEEAASEAYKKVCAGLR